MPWWLLGVSMDATTFSTDTESSDRFSEAKWSIKEIGFGGLLLTGMLTVFVMPGCGACAEILTDIEFYELRYSGKAAFLRGFPEPYTLGWFLMCL